MMLRQINEDIAVALEKDPAARNALEVLFLYPGVHALIVYRVTHLLWGMGLKFIARGLSQWYALYSGSLHWHQSIHFQQMYSSFPMQ